MIQIILIIGLALTGYGCTHPFKHAAKNLTADLEESDDKLDIIDAHTHTFLDTASKAAFPMKVATEADFFNELKAAGVRAAIAHTVYENGAYVDLRARNVIHCAGIGPKVNTQFVTKGLQSGKYSCIKIYLGYIPRYAYDRAYQPLYKLAEKYSVPVVFHTGDTVVKDAVIKYADPLTIDEVAVKFPKVKFVIAHCGNPWIQSAAEVAYKNDNVYMDVSGFLIGNVDEQSTEKVDTYVIKPVKWIFGYVENPKKLMFGSDWPLTNIRTYAEAIKKAIPREYWQDVFHDNALEVFPALKAMLHKNTE